MANGNGNGQLKLSLTGDPAEFQGVVQAMATPDTLGGLFGHPAAQPMYPMPAPDDSGGQPTPTLPASGTTVQAGLSPVPQQQDSPTPGTLVPPTGALPPITSAAPAATDTAALPPLPGSLPPAEMPPASFGAGAAPAAPLVGPLAGSQLPTTPTGPLPQAMGGPLGGITKPPQTTGQKILGALGKIGGTALGIVAPGVAMQIPQTPLGKIAAQARAMRQQELQLGFAKTQADMVRAQAEAQKAATEAQVAARGTYEPSGIPGVIFNKNTGRFEMGTGLDLPPGYLGGFMAKDLPPTYRPYPGDVDALNRRNATRFNAIPANLRGKANLSDYQVGPKPTEDDVTKADEGLKVFEQLAIENQKLADSERDRQFQHQMALGLADLRKDAQARADENQKFLDTEPVIATIPNPANPSQKMRVQTTRLEAGKMPGVTAIGKPDSSEIAKDRTQATQYAVVQDTLSAYRQDYNAIKDAIPTPAIQAMTEIDSIGQKQPGGGGGLLGAITMGTANTLLVDPKERAQVGEDWKELSQYPGLVKLMSDYYQAKESAITYIKALDQVGRGVQQAVQQDMQNIPQPWVGGDIANQRFDSMQRVYDRSMRSTVRFPGEIPSPEEIKAEYAQPAAAAPAGRPSAAPAGGQETKQYGGFNYTKGADGQWHKGSAVTAQ